MKSNKLWNAITEIDSEMIIDATQYEFKAKSGRGWKIAAMAACLALSIVAGIIFRPNGENIYLGNIYLKAYAITSGQYPELTPYPQGLDDDSDEFYEAYKLWNNSRSEHLKNYSAEHKVDAEFIARTVPRFIGDAEGENPVYSPLSLYMALAMLAETTEGESRQQILDILGEGDLQSLRTAANAIWNRNYRDDGAAKTILASSLWLNEKVNFNSKTLNTISQNYYSDTFKGNMADPNYTQAFQYWLNQQTEGLLEEQIAELEFDRNTVLALAATLFFEAKWDVEFRENATKPSTFHAKSRDVTCDFMNGTENTTYYWGDKFTAAVRSFEESGSMLFILPDEGYDAEELLSDSQVAQLISGEYTNAKGCLVNFSLPKFDVCSTTDLIPGLKKLGVKDIFSNRADFSPLTDEDVFVNKAEQSSRVTIDETGCKAATYTVMLLMGGGVPSGETADLVLDRPFIFVIRGDNNTPLFVGVVNDPTK